MDLMAYLPQFGSVLWTLLAFVVALSVIVAVHEYGHYIVARWSGIHADVFSLGFGPVIYSRVDKRGTKWQIAAIPLGGYVKFMGDANAASGKDGEVVSSLSPQELRRTMHGAPLWARSATVAAGPIFNFILSIVIFTGIFWSSGTISSPPVIAKLHTLPFAGITVQPGDKILQVEGVDYDTEALSEFLETLEPRALITYTVERAGQQITAQGPMLTPAKITSVGVGSAGEKAGLQVGDVILSADGQEVFRFQELIDIVRVTQGKPINLKIWRAEQELDFLIEPMRRDIPLPDNSFETRWLIGVTDGLFFEPTTEAQSFTTAVGLGVERTYDIMALSISGLYHMATRKISSCNMSGPIGIAKASSQMASAGIVAFIGFLGLLSTAIGLFNLFPVPVLDGGHLVFYAYEAVVGKPPSDKALRIMMTAGLVLILSLMAFALSNDLFCP